MDLCSSVEDDFIVVSPSEAGEPPLEYCAQDESRPKLFGVWGALVPVGKAVTSLLSTFLDSHKKGTTMNNVTIEEVSPPRHECAQANEGKESESHLKSDSHETRRKSLRRSKAISLASDELETEYSFHRFKLNSKDNSTDDYFVLKVKTRSTSSLATTLPPPTTENRSLQNFAETLYSNENGLPDEVEKDSPAILESDQFFNHGSPVIIRRGSGMSNKKSISLPSRTDIVSPDSLISVNWHARGSLQPTSNYGHILESISKKRLSEQSIKDVVKSHCDDFVNYSNWSTLLPYLEAAELLDPDTRDKLMNNYLSEREKSLFFYLTALPSQGKAAYTTFYKCLMQEKEHAGHKTLQEYFDPFSY